MIIGSFTKVDEGYTGSLATVTLSVKASIPPAEKRNDNAPDFRVLVGRGNEYAERVFMQSDNPSDDRNSRVFLRSKP